MNLPVPAALCRSWPPQKRVGCFTKRLSKAAIPLPDLPRETALARGQRLAEHLHLPNATAERLRELPADVFWSLEPPYNIGPVPIVGDAVLPQPMLDVFFAGKQHAMPVLVGSNSDEASVMPVFGIDLAGQIKKLRRGEAVGARAH
ncbi:Uncharacterised protein [Kluyvera cryocrescens]|uniref:Carboxylesterase type B domain-containing protein n=1 Tax=Kluyvera cryocrescens TaxID=580 RepID=A0A485CQQ7_KLUCR|nr:Uncharacterised protein [Kluyvera cryocrescens]